MNILAIVTALFLMSIENSLEQKTTNSTYQIENTPEGINITDPLYNLQLKIETTANNNYNLIIDIKLGEGAWYISPFETKNFTGKFYLDLGSYEALSFGENIIETPRAVASYDGFADAPVISVKENTAYKQPLNKLRESNFEVFGRVQFTIEPRCSFEEIPFAITYKDGVMKLSSPKC